MQRPEPEPLCFQGCRRIPTGPRAAVSPFLFRFTLFMGGFEEHGSSAEPGEWKVNGLFEATIPSFLCSLLMVMSPSTEVQPGAVVRSLQIPLYLICRWHSCIQLSYHRSVVALHRESLM